MLLIGKSQSERRGLLPLVVADGGAAIGFKGKEIPGPDWLWESDFRAKSSKGVCAYTPVFLGKPSDIEFEGETRNPTAQPLLSAGLRSPAGDN